MTERVQIMRLLERKSPSLKSQKSLAGMSRRSIASSAATLPPPVRQSITFDRGTEFVAWRKLYETAGIKSYFVTSPLLIRKAALKTAMAELGATCGWRPISPRSKMGLCPKLLGGWTIRPVGASAIEHRAKSSTRNSPRLKPRA